jgi:hypothetical protein
MCPKYVLEVKGNNDEEFHKDNHKHSRTLTALLSKLEYMYSSVNVCGPRYTGLAFRIQQILTPLFWPFVTGSDKSGWCHVVDD